MHQGRWATGWLVSVAMLSSLMDLRALLSLSLALWPVYVGKVPLPGKSSYVGMPRMVANEV